MHRILPLIRKDLKHLAPQAYVLWALMAIACYSDYNGRYHMADSVHSTLRLLISLTPLFCGAFVVFAIQQESLIGDRQYWLTRPFTWRDLLASKALFVLLTVNLPLFLLQAASMALHGLAPYAHLPELLWRQVFFTAFLVMVPAALAAITRTGGHALAAAVLTAFVWIMITLLAQNLPDWGAAGAEWISTATMTLLAVPVCAAIVFLQYRRRRPAIPRVLFAAIVLLTIPALRLSGTYSYAIQGRLSTRTISPSEFPIAFDPRKEPPVYQRYRYPNFVQLEIPVRVNGLADGDELTINRLELSPDLQLLVRGGFEHANGNSSFHDFTNGAGWLRLFVDSTAYYRAARAPMDLRGSADVTLFVRTATVDDSSSRADVPGVGVCGPYPVGCFTALPRASVEAYEGKSFVSYVISPYDTYAPFPAEYLLNPVTEKFTSPGALVVRKPVAWFHRTFEFRNIRLSDFVR